MSKPPRVSYPDVFFHIISRSVEGISMFQDDIEFKKYLNLLKKYAPLYNISIHSYVLLNTHIHIIAEVPLDNISNFMKSLNTSYAIFINKRRNRKGHLFAGRFKSIIVDSSKYLISLSRYIHLNPVNAGIVKLPGEYPWSSFKYFVQKRTPPPFLNINLILSAFSGSRKKYYEFVIEGIGKSEETIIPPSQKFNGAEFYSNTTFAKKIYAKFERRKGVKKQDKRRWKDKLKPIRYDKIVSITFSFFDLSISLKELQDKTDDKHTSIKMILSYLLKKYSDLSIVEIAEMLGYKHPSTISMQIKKIGKIIEGGKTAYSEVINNIIKDFEILKDRP